MVCSNRNCDHNFFDREFQQSQHNHLFYSSILSAVSEDFPHQENLGCQAEAEQAYSSLGENEDWQYHQVLSRYLIRIETFFKP